MLDEFRGLHTYFEEHMDCIEARMDHYETTLAGYGTRIDRMESDLRALHHHLSPFAYTTPPHHSLAHFTPIAHASHRSFPAASEDRETLGSRDTISSLIYFLLLVALSFSSETPIPLMTLMPLRWMTLRKMKTPIGLSQ